mgnify:CR=1 FL=1
MIISIHQPMYLPWTPYIAKLMYSDIFVVFDTVQYPGGKSFTNRNYIYQKNNSVLLTLPIEKYSLGRKFFEININLNTNWYDKHFKTIEMAYSKSINSNLIKQLMQLYEAHNIGSNFTKYCISHLELIKKNLELKTTIVRASDLKNNLTGLDRIMAILNNFNATTYITGTGKGSMRYMDRDRFQRENIILKTLDYNDDLYKYKFGEIRSGAFIDLMINKGKGTAKHIFENTRLKEF